MVCLFIMLLVVDNDSVYTADLIKFLKRKNFEFRVSSFENLNLSELASIDSFILSGRRKNNKIMNSVNSKIIRYSLAEEKPLLGICYGAEILALTLGGTIKRMNSLHKGLTQIKVLKPNDLCNKKIEVYESHHYEISRLGTNLSQIAHSVSCKYEIIKHNNQKIFGTQFHPEMSKDGQDLIEKFISL